MLTTIKIGNTYYHIAACYVVKAYERVARVFNLFMTTLLVVCSYEINFGKLNYYAMLI